MTDETGVIINPNKMRAIETLGGAFMGGIAMGGDFHRGPWVTIVAMVAGTTRRTYELGNTVGIEVEFYDESGVLFSPTNSTAYITVIDPKGVTRYDEVPMDPRGTGRFIFELPLALTDPRGTWRIRVHGDATSGNPISNSMRLYTEVVA